MQKEYRSIKEVVGPLMLVEGVEGVKFDELVEIECHGGNYERFLILSRRRAVCS